MRRFGPPKATALLVILIPIIAGRILHATRALRAAHDPKFRLALLRRLFPLETFPTGDRADSADMWNAVRDELGVQHEDEEAEANFLLNYWAQEIVEGRVDVLPGARLMYRSGWFPLGQPRLLHELVYLLDVWDDMPQRREQTAAELLHFARKLSGRES